MKENKVLITPKTKISDLLDAYPELEDTLIQIAPAFRRLKNPVLRKTVARVTSIQQAAAIGKVKTEDLVNRLRQETGQDNYLSESAETEYVQPQPAWFSEDRIALKMDVRPMLDRGEHPVHDVIQNLRQLEEGRILEVTAPFLPAPMIDKATGLGYEHWVRERDSNMFQVYFIRKEQ